MNKTAIKNFAIWARNKLIADIVYQAGLLGVTDKGIAQPLPQSTGEVQFFDIGTKDYMTVRGKAIRQRNAFVAAIKVKQADTDYASAFRFVVEKVAYTWFNRLIAIRFMEVNDYLPGRVRVLSSENPGKAEPDMVTRPFDTDMSFSAQEQDEIMRMKDENKLDELFRMLFIKQCQKLHEVLPGLFDPQGIERVDSYLELLLTISFTDKDGVLWHLVHDIDEDDFNVEKEGQVEIIGWMYQYYNTEPKDQVFANLKKNIKISKDNIPAATQLFTPDWIVRYMVENSLGRLWVEGHPNEELKKNWKYYLEEAEQEPQVQVQLAEIRKEYAALRPEEIKVIDPCMGSGHILVYLFDVLMQIYESQGWTQREAAQSIVQNNLYGLDIDDRAAQLAYFAVMMKARQYDRRFLERGIVPHVYGIQESNDINREQIELFGKGMSSIEINNAVNQLNEMLDVLQDAKEYGSVLNVPELDWELLKRYAAEINESGQMSLASVGADEALHVVRRLIDQAQAMAQKYHAVVTNPPYMEIASGTKRLVEYVNARYIGGKTDLFAVFIERNMAFALPTGFISMITQPSLTSLVSFEKLRRKLFTSKTFYSFVHMGRGIFGIDFGSVSFTFRNCHIEQYNGRYYRLYERTFQFINPEDIRRIFLLSKENIAFRFDFDKYETNNGITDSLCYSGSRTSFLAKQDQFLLVPGIPFAYTMSEKMIKAYSLGTLGELFVTREGMATAGNDEFLRLWYEVDISDICFNCHDSLTAKSSGMKWFPYNKGGDYRKWYGNNDYIVDWENDGFRVRNNKDPKTGRIRSHNYNGDYAFKRGLTWSSISAGDISIRWSEPGFLFDSKGAKGFCEDEDKLYAILGFLNSSTAMRYLKVISPTMDFKVGDIIQLPLNKSIFSNQELISLVKECISLVREDWDTKETSWGFSGFPFGQEASLENDVEKYIRNANHIRELLMSYEERINVIISDIYDLSDETRTEVSNEKLSLSQVDLYSIITRFISYAVGCMFGRYSLSRPGLVYAGKDWDLNNYTLYKPDPDNCIPITDEAYFEDDIVGRFVEFVRVIYGDESLEENLNYIANVLGHKDNTSREAIRYYFLSKFFNEHCAAYSITGSGKRPIYWLFDSGKQNSFKALVYMHRWNADTVGNLRVEYLHRMQRVYEKEIERMQDIIDNSRDNREVNQASKRREKLVKQLKEARDYDAKIAHVALSRVEIDLDDGVKVNYEKVQKGPDGKSLGILAKI